jgi:hypothetical protein
MARRGRKRQLDAESLYWQLILSKLDQLRRVKASDGLQCFLWHT